MQPPAGSQVSRVPAQRMPPGQPAVEPPPAPPPPTARRPGLRLTLMVVAGALAFFCMAGAGVAYVLYDNYTTPDRSAPDVVVDNYLRAFLVDRNDIRARQLICPENELTELYDLRTDLQVREERFQVSIKRSWGPLALRYQEDAAEVEVQLTLSAVVNGIAQTELQPWRFTVKRGEGWRVCSAARIG